MGLNWKMDGSELGASDAPSLAAALAALRRLSQMTGRSSRDLSLFSDGDAGAVFRACFDDLSCRYYVTAREPDEVAESALCDAEQPDGEVEALIGGQTVPEEQRHLVGMEAAESALRYFFETGRKNPGQLWDEC